MSRHTTRNLASCAAAAAMIVGGVATGTAAADNASDNRIVAGGTLLDFDGDMSWGVPSSANPEVFANPNQTGFICTLGAVGTDSAGRKVGITAGHCNPGAKKEDTHPKIIPTAQNGVEYLDNSHPVWNRRELLGNPAASPIGWIRFVDEKGLLANGDLNPKTTTDYMVIEFAPDVTLSSQVRDENNNPLFKLNSLHKDGTGALTTPGAFSFVENYGAVSDRDNVDGQANGYDSGLCTGTKDGLIWSFADMTGGDSGGPVAVRGTGKWTGINSATVIDIPRNVATSAKNILDDLNPRGITGSGFTITNN